MRWPWGRNEPTSAPLEVLIAEAVARRLVDIDPMGLPVVVAGRRLIADQVGTLPIVAVREATGERVTPTPSILRRPDPAEPRRRTLEKICNALTRHGTAWLQTYRLAEDGWPLAARVVDTARVNAEVDHASQRVARVWVDGLEQDPRNMHYIPFVSDPGPLGRSPLADIRPTLEQLVAVLDWSASYYADGGPVPYALRNSANMPAEVAAGMLDKWVEARRARRPALLTGTWSLENFTLPSAADALLVDALDYLDAAAARALLIPPALINVRSLSSLTYSTTEGQRRAWLSESLYPGYLARIEAGFSDLLPRGQEAHFDTSNFLRTDQATRIQTLAVSVGAGIHTTTEARVLEGLPPVPDPSPVPISPNVEGL